MGWYNVVKPCVVGKLHYARPTTQPIEVDDEVAGPLVEAGSLTPYPAHVEGKTGTVLDGVLKTVGDLGGEFAEIAKRDPGPLVPDDEPVAEHPTPRRPRKPRSED
jgi:hypothetical protein